MNTEKHRSKKEYVHKLLMPFMAVSCVMAIVAGCASNSNMTTKLIYPVTAKTNVVETLHMASVSDPYRWLEDDNSAATKA